MKRVVDGDTIAVVKNDREVKVRLIGVDTPESVASGYNTYKNCKEGKLAANFTEEQLSGKTVYLEYDISPRDKYCRDLCYVYLENGKMFNEILLEKGYARTMTIQPNVKYADKFLKVQQKAEENKVGFWNLQSLPWVS